MSGGWAAKEFCEKGLKTLVIERGREVTHRVDYQGENKAPWDMKFRDQIHPDIKAANPVQSLCYAFYSVEEGKKFAWIRADNTGGRSVLWARQTYRWSDLDFEANKKDGHGIDWPIRYKDIAPWYDHVEKFVGVSGSVENIPHLPDGEFLPAMQMNCVEKSIKQSIEDKFDNRKMIIGRSAHLTQPTQQHLSLGRGSCQYRNQCQRGCSFGAYFSSLSATLPAAKRTDNLSMLHDSHVESLIYDPKTKRATGVRVVNRKTNERHEYKAKVIFLCASTFGSLQVMLNSTSESFKNGFANSSGTLGQYIMDHHESIGARGNFPGFDDQYYKGRRPNGVYIPRFRNVNGDVRPDYLRGFGFQGRAERSSWQSTQHQPGFGVDYKNAMRKPAPWVFSLFGFGEMLPAVTNRVSLHATKTDQWGVPLLHIVHTYDNGVHLGLGIHEMGGARMGNDPSESVLNKYNQCHDVPNVYVTDGAAMTSSACQNPSITYMALTARAVEHAVNQLKAS